MTARDELLREAVEALRALSNATALDAHDQGGHYSSFETKVISGVARTTLTKIEAHLKENGNE